MLCLSACPCTMPRMHCERLVCVGPRTSDPLLSARAVENKPAASFFVTITSTLVKTRFLTQHDMHMLLLHPGTLWLWITMSILGFHYKCGGNGSYFLNFSADNWIKSGKEHIPASKHHVIARSILMYVKQTLLTSMFFLDPSAGGESMAVILYVRKKNRWFCRIYNHSSYTYSTCLNSLFNHVHAVCVYMWLSCSLFSIFCFAEQLWQT